MAASSKIVRCVIYIRVSSQMQVEGHSLDAQRDICTKFAEGRGWVVVKVFEGEGESAKNDQRKAFQQMIAFVRDGNADVVLTHKIDRFARNVVDALTYLHEFNERGVAYCSATEQFDFTTPWGKMQLVMLAAFAELYLDNLRAETIKGKRKRAEKGLWNGDLPFGYYTTADGKIAEVDSDKAVAVKLAFESYATGSYSILQIAKMLNRQGFRTSGKGKRGPKPFSKDTVAMMLSNVFYTGKVSYKSGEIFPGQHRAIISDELFERCQARRRQAATQPRRVNVTKHVYPLAGLLYCAHCKRPLRGQAQGQNRYYRDPARDYDEECPSVAYLNADVLENQIGDVFGAMQLPEAWQAEIMQTLQATSNPDDLQRRRKNIEQRLKRAKDLYVNGAYSEEEYLRIDKEAKAELDALRPIQATDLTNAAMFLQDLPRVWQFTNLEEKKRLLQSMIERAFVSNGLVVAIQPNAEFYPLFLTVLVSGGPDGHPIAVKLKSVFVALGLLQLVPPATPLSRVAIPGIAA